MRPSLTPTLALVAALLLLNACAAPPSPRQGDGGRGRAPAYGSGAACVVDLNYLGVAFDRVADSARDGACGVAGAVLVSQAPTPLSRPAVADCALARQLALWDEQVVQPAARALFGQAVKTLHHYGTYNCRTRTTSRHRLSEHAYGKAIDIAAFELADGTMISVLRDWPGGGAKADYLRRVARGACPLFSVVLTPNSDKAHANHFHLDVGPWKLCSL